MEGSIRANGNIQFLLENTGTKMDVPEYCYQYMFDCCESLTQAPALPATTLAYECYFYMFYGCISLTKAPELPATTLADSCYCYMFQGCTSLTQVPELPATALADWCYYYMFAGCESLTQAPALPATTLADGCYYSMFMNCVNLSSINVSFIDWNWEYISTEYWLCNVASEGTFICLDGLYDIRGESYIPEGWEIIRKQ